MNPDGAAMLGLRLLGELCSDRVGNKITCQILGRTMFKASQLVDLRCYVADPACKDAYRWIHEKLAETTTDFIAKEKDFNERIKGNLGEFVAFHITRREVEPGSGWYIFYSNVDTPLSRISGAGLDICFLYLDADDTGLKDKLCIQEVKTTGSPSLEYAKALVADYDKLRSADTSVNLQTRVRSLKARMRDTYGITDQKVLDRVQLLAHPDPSKCQKVYLLPTLVHEIKGADPAKALAQVRSEISGQGWQLTLINPVSIGLTRLNDGFLHLAQNKTFVP